MRLPAPITSRTNARVKALRASLSGEARTPGDLLGLEGEHLVREAHQHGASLETVYLREGSESLLDRADGLLALEPKQWVVLSREVFDGAVTTATPQGVAATWVIAEPTKAPQAFRAGLLLEGLQDPGNVGTLIRSAAAFGQTDVILTPDSVNPWNPKAVRSAAGAVFGIRIRRMPLAQAVEDLREQGVRIFAAVSSFQKSLTRADVPPRGIPPGLLPPGVLRAESLNQKMPGQMLDLEPCGSLPAKVQNSSPLSLSYDTDFTESCAILIGNEGAGLSDHARLLADEEVMIPCQVESLNAAVAGSILMYEAMRQLTLRSRARQQTRHP